MVAPTFMPCKLKSRESVTAYNPHFKAVHLQSRDMRVRGYTSFSNALAREYRLVGQGTTVILPNLERITCPALEREVVMSLGGNPLWANSLQAMDGFVLGKDESIPKSMTPMPVKAERPFLII